MIARGQVDDLPLPFPPAWLQLLGARAAPLGRLLGYRWTFEVGVPTEALPNAAAIPGPNDFDFITMLAYDTTILLIHAIDRVIGDAGGNMPSREQVRAEIVKTRGFAG